MLNSAQATVNAQWVTEFYPLRIQKIHKFCTTLKVHMYGAKTIAVTKCKPFHVRLNWALQVATK